MINQCKKCPEPTATFSRYKGPHLGLYCMRCGNWIRWIPKSEQVPKIETVPQAPNDTLPPPECLVLTYLPTYVQVRNRRYTVHEQEDGDIMLIRQHETDEVPF